MSELPVPNAPLFLESGWMKSLSFYYLLEFTYTVLTHVPDHKSTYHWPKKVPQDLKLLHASTVETVSWRCEGDHRKQKKELCRKSTFPGTCRWFSNSAYVACSHGQPPQHFQTPFSAQQHTSTPTHNTEPQKEHIRLWTLSSQVLAVSKEVNGNTLSRGKEW